MRSAIAVAVALALAFCGVADAQSRATQPDPFVLSENDLGRGPLIPPRDTSGLTLDTQTVNTGVQNCILITVGQSNIARTAPTPFTTVNPNSLSMLNIYDGALYKAKDPVIGTGDAVTANGAHVGLRVADTLVTNGKCSRVILVPIAIISTSSSDWASGGIYWDRIGVAVRRVKARGINCGTTNISCVIIWGQGETDCAFGFSQALSTANLNSIFANAAAAGFVGRWLINTETWTNTVFCPSTTGAAQAAVVNNTTIFAGANADAVFGSICGAGANLACRQADLAHFTDAGNFTLAAAMVTALHNSGLPY